MKDKAITKELAKLYESQGYLEDALEGYLILYTQTKKQEFADAIEKIKHKLSSDSTNLSERGNKPKLHWEKPGSIKADSETIDTGSTRTLKLFEEWVNIVVLEKKIRKFKKPQVK